MFFFFLIAPSFGPGTFVTTELNETTFNISWSPLPTEKSNGIVVLYEAKAELVVTRPRSQLAVTSSKGLNTTKPLLFLMISSLVPCTESLFGLLRPLDLGPMVRPHCYRHQVSSYSYPRPLFQNEARYQTFQIIFTLSLVLK